MIFSKFRWSDTEVLELTQASSAYLYFFNHRINLLNGLKEPFDLNLFFRQLEMINLQDEFSSPMVYHFYYELGLIFIDPDYLCPENTPLALEIHYQEKKISKKPLSLLKHLPLTFSGRPLESDYLRAFNLIQKNLLEGHCYQVNLTFPFFFESKISLSSEEICDFFFSRSDLSAYAHATFLGEEMILSNSPECLFQYDSNCLHTLPIKGTLKREGRSRHLWKQMLKNPKEKGELNMITDLLRNDLNRLDLPEARVIRKRLPLRVPGLLHQCSLISLKLKRSISLLHTLKCLFPGGSVTGAPKKRVMQIIQNVETTERGVYCGSTLLCYGEKKVSSINIRTAVIDLKKNSWKYGAGGGITLLSRPRAEFKEMNSKVESFLTLFNGAS